MASNNSNNSLEKAFYTLVGLSLEQKKNFETFVDEFFEKNEEAYKKGKELVDDVSEKAKASAEDLKTNWKEANVKFSTSGSVEVDKEEFEALKKRVEELEKEKVQNAVEVEVEEIEEVK